MTVTIAADIAIIIALTVAAFVYMDVTAIEGVICIFICSFKEYHNCDYSCIHQCSY